MAKPDPEMVELRRGGDKAKTPSAKGAGPAMKSNISKAVSCLEEQTERGRHVPEVGGHKMHGHSGKMSGGEY